MDTTGEKEKRAPKENVDGRSTSRKRMEEVQAAMTTRNLEPDK
jgi:hypothetical protein